MLCIQNQYNFPPLYKNQLLPHLQVIFPLLKMYGLGLLISKLQYILDNFGDEIGKINIATLSLTTLSLPHPPNIPSTSLLPSFAFLSVSHSFPFQVIRSTCLVCPSSVWCVLNLHLHSIMLYVSFFFNMNRQELNFSLASLIVILFSIYQISKITTAKEKSCTDYILPSFFKRQIHILFALLFFLELKKSWQP